MSRSEPRPGGSRGAATLAMNLLLFAATALLVWFASRQLLLEQRMAADQVRAAQAFEAAEAGLDWALAMLNDDRRVDANCNPTADLAAPSFRRRFLHEADEGGLLAPIAGRVAVCEWGSQADWRCNCSEPDARPVTPSDGPSFRVTFVASGQPGSLRARALACTGPASTCSAAAQPGPDASARHETAFALLSALPSPPAAALSLRGRVETGAAAFGFLDRDPATGLAVHAGGAVHAPGARFVGPPGTPRSALVVEHDPALARADPARFFASHFGASRLAWAALPGVHRQPCARDCSADLLDLVARHDGLLAIHVDGDLRLAGPLELGTPERPLILVVDGELRVEGEVRVHGVLHARALDWSHGGPGGKVQGALLLETDLGGDAAPQIARDAAVLGLLSRGSGGFARVPGAWRDF